MGKQSLPQTCRSRFVHLPLLLEDFLKHAVDKMALDKIARTAAHECLQAFNKMHDTALDREAEFAAVDCKFEIETCSLRLKIPPP